MHVILWRFEVAKSCASHFEQVYGAEGDWARLFRQAPGFLGTELLRDVEPRDDERGGASSFYVTLDRWESAEAFETFQRKRGADYQALDARCEALTLREEKLGHFDAVPSSPVAVARPPRPAHPAPTARLFFRTWSAEDLPLARALWGDERVTARIGGPFSDQAVQARLEAELQRQEELGSQYWPLFLRSSGAHVGCCGLRPYDAARGVLELGFHLRPEHWGQGLATEAAEAAIRFGFECLGARGLFAGHHPDNASSRRALERLGFQLTGEELYPPTGLLHPSYLLTAEAYRSCAAAPSGSPQAPEITDGTADEK